MVRGPLSGSMEDGMKGFNSVSMTCPHCLREAVFGIQNATYDLPASGSDGSLAYVPKYGYCPSSECGRLVVLVTETVNGEPNGGAPRDRLVVPPVRSVVGFADVPEDTLSDYVEAVQVLEISPNASAALARRCLQSAIRRLLGKDGGTLRGEIAEFREKSQAPPYLKESLGDIRAIGNVASHPGLDKHTSMIVNVDPDDARGLLRILEEVFRHCFADPKEFERRMGQKKEGAGRPGGRPSGSAGDGDRT